MGFFDVVTVVSVFAAFNAIFLALLAHVDAIQRGIIFLNFVNIPFGNISDPDRFGLGPGENVHITTRDGETLFGWLLPSLASCAPKDVNVNHEQYILQPNEENKETVQEYALFLHGNGGNIAMRNRRGMYQLLRSRANMNVLAVDYRGFGKSSGSPSEDGLTLDVIAMWDFLVERALPEHIYVIGHSLGTAVVCALLEHLHKQSIQPKSVILIAPFTTLMDAVYLHPMYLIYRPFPFIRKYADANLRYRFESINRIGCIECPLMIIHGTLDFIVAEKLGRKLYTRAKELQRCSSVEYVCVNTPLFCLQS
eukprot:gene9444-1686_t